MNILYTTQSEGIALFTTLHDVLRAKADVSRAGFILADRAAYRGWLRDHPSFEKQSHRLLKEWDVTGARKTKPDMQKIAAYEKLLGAEAGLFGALVADRRLYMGPDCTYTQDYRRRFTDNELWSILQKGLEETEKLFDDLKPDVFVNFICVTFLDYLAYLFARARGVRVLNLRPTRVGDRVGFNSTLNDPSPEFMATYRALRDNNASPYLDEARAYIQRVRESHGRYEGVVRPSSKPAMKLNVARDPLYKVALRILQNYATYWISGDWRDNHVTNPLRMLMHNALINPMRARVTNRYLSSRYLTAETLGVERYAFYPLHTEPEVSLLVYGRPYVNQIEIIRMLAMSLPADMVLVVKEHPWMVGKRSLGAYKKLLNIPRVRIASPALDARDVIGKAALVAVVTGSVALEAVMLGKPVLTFGECPYNALPPSILRRCEDPRRLPSVIRGLIDGYSNDEKALLAYMCAVMETAASVNLYSVLLKKKGVYTERSTDFDAEIARLADCLLATMAQPVPSVDPSDPVCARW